MDLINRKEINFHCSYNGDCMGDIEKCKKCEDYVCTYQEVYEKEACSIAFKALDTLERIKELEQAGQNTYYAGAKDLIEWLLSNDKYTACTIDTDDNCIVCDVGFIEDMHTVSVDELFKEFQKETSNEENNTYCNVSINCRESMKSLYKQAINDMTDNLIRNSRTEVIDGKISLIVTAERIKIIAEKMKEDIK